MKFSAFWLSFIALFVLNTGCASTAVGVNTSSIKQNMPVQPLVTPEPPPGSALIIVRYPAAVDPDAQDAWQDGYLAAAGRSGVGSNPDARAYIDVQTIKSSYFALSVYKELSRRLPDHSVLLSPHLIKLDSNGGLTSEPMTSAESLPSILKVDFATFTDPDPEQIMKARTVSFGDLITPVVSVRADPRAAPSTKGILLTSTPLSGAALSNGAERMEASMVAILNGRFESDVPPLALVSYIAGDVDRGLASELLNDGEFDNTAQLYPVEALRLSRFELGQMNTDKSANADPLSEPFSSAFALRIIALLDDIDLKKAAMIQRAAAIEDYDPALAPLSFGGLSSPDYVARVRYVDRLLDAERKYLSVQSLRLYDGIQNGEMGAQVRDMLIAETEIIDERRELARQQNMATAAAILAGVAAVGVAANSGDNVGLDELIAVNVLTDLTILAGVQAWQLREQSLAVGANYLGAIAPALDEQVEVQVDMLDSSETITAIRFEDLQSKLQTLYNERQRALDVEGSTCAYKPEGEGGEIGRWNGVCANGVANGPGVGVVKRADGSSEQYFGEALNGQPHGRGYIIMSDSRGAWGMEGRFEGGQANGIMRVSRAGRADTIRTYSAGSDRGPAPYGAIVEGLFSPQSDVGG
ncbi:MAG: hypothetical protein AAGH90_05055 [Pseudomonadota bacterium]